jgi:arylsulfatase A-like enzyme/tetratricopeptide (TPR) repeat protein
MVIRRATAVVLVCAVSAGCVKRTEQVPPSRHPSNILLITIDTLRADRLGHGLTPTLDALAARGLRFTNARSNVPLTLPAHASIMTGTLPPVHGGRVNGTPVPSVRDTIASRLSRAGYRTGAVIGAFVLDRRFGLAHGFDEYDDRVPRDPKALDQLQAERRANVVVDAAIGWLGKTASDKPWFLWVHLYDPHAPYDPPGLAAPAAPAAAYDQEVAFADREAGRLLTTITAREDSSNTAIVALGDHGESLGDHGEMTHGMLLFESAVRVPLIVAAPGVAPADRAEPVSLVDVLPTTLALAQQPADTSMQGRNLLGAIDSDAESYAETEYPAVAGWRPARMLVQDRWKLIASSGSRLFDVATDPAEKNDVSSARASIVQAMQRRLEELSRTPSGTAPAKTIDPDTAARLRSLGYVAPSTSPPSSVSSAPSADDAIADWAAFELALNAENAGRPQEAVTTFQRLAVKHPDGQVFLSSYARVLVESKRAREAVTAYKRAVQRWPGDAALYHELAVAARAAGDRGEANRAEQASLTLSPDLPIAHNGLGLLHADEGRYADAVASFSRAVSLDPTNASYLVNLGNAHRAAGQLDQAADAYRKALDRDSTLADAANGIGVVLVQQKRAADAVEYFEQAIRQDGAFGEAQLNLGIALQESGQRDRAIAQYRTVEQLKTASARDKQAAHTLRLQLERR